MHATADTMSAQSFRVCSLGVSHGV